MKEDEDDGGVIVGHRVFARRSWAIGPQSSILDLRSSGLRSSFLYPRCAASRVFAPRRSILGWGPRDGSGEGEGWRMSG